MSSSDRLKTLIGRLEPTDVELARVESHLTSVANCLKAGFTVTKVQVIGSFSRGTAIHGLSDSDLLVAVDKRVDAWARGAVISSTTLLAKFRAALEGRFGSRDTEIRRDEQAMVVRFAQHSVDVVPALKMQRAMVGTSSAYLIPNGIGGWLKTSPTAHNSYINAANKRSGGRLRFVAMLMKYWRTCREPKVSISSFHLELLLAQTELCSPGKSYGACLRDTLALLASRGCRDLQDPLGISGFIPASATSAKQKSALATVRDSLFHAEAALAAEAARNSPEAYRQWNIVFHGNFPAS